MATYNDRWMGDSSRNTSTASHVSTRHELCRHLHSINLHSLICEVFFFTPSFCFVCLREIECVFVLDVEETLCGRLASQ